MLTKQQRAEVLYLIAYYELHGFDWSYAAEFLLHKFNNENAKKHLLLADNSTGLRSRQGRNQTATLASRKSRRATERG